VAFADAETQLQEAKKARVRRLNAVLDELRSEKGTCVDFRRETVYGSVALGNVLLTEETDNTGFAEGAI